MPQTASKEGKQDRKKEGELKGDEGAGGRRREVWKCFREKRGKKRPLREYVNAKPVC